MAYVASVLAGAVAEPQQEGTLESTCCLPLLYLHSLWLPDNGSGCI
jgi:hypothetical protein